MKGGVMNTKGEVFRKTQTTRELIERCAELQSGVREVLEEIQLLNMRDPFPEEETDWEMNPSLAQKKDHRMRAGPFNFLYFL